MGSIILERSNFGGFSVSLTTSIEVAAVIRPPLKTDFRSQQKRLLLH